MRICISATLQRLPDLSSLPLVPACIMVEVDEVDAETLEREFPDSHSVLERVTYRFESVTRSGLTMGELNLQAPANCRCMILQDAWSRSMF